MAWIIVVLAALFAKEASLLAASPPEQASSTDKFGRLLRAEHKQIIPCPAQDEHTAVLLLIGQSNSANYAERFYQSAYGSSVVNFVDGVCYVAGSPLLGASGKQGEVWTAVANRLVASDTFKSVILVPAGIGGTSIDRWQSGGDLNSMLMDVLARTKQNYTITYVLWHQGETDYKLGTSKASYTKSFQSLVRSLREHGVAAPVFVSVATKCDNPAWSVSNPVAEAQRVLPNDAEKILAGIDTDTLLGNADRSDNCHFSAAGQEKSADAWAERIEMQRKRDHLSRRPPGFRSGLN